MVTDSYWTYCGDHLVRCINVGPLCRTPETDWCCMSTTLWLKNKRKYLFCSKLENKTKLSLPLGWLGLQLISEFISMWLEFFPLLMSFQVLWLIFLYWFDVMGISIPGKFLLYILGRTQLFILHVWHTLSDTLFFLHVIYLAVLPAA